MSDYLRYYSQAHCKRIRTCQTCRGAARAQFLWTHSEVLERVNLAGEKVYSRRSTMMYLCYDHAVYWAGEFKLPWPLNGVDPRKRNDIQKMNRKRKPRWRRAVDPKSIKTIFTRRRKRNAE